MNFARINHILIPQTPEQRSRFRNSLAGRLAGKVLQLWLVTTPAGRLLAGASLIVGGLGLDTVNTHIYLVWCGMVGILVGSAVVRSGFALHNVAMELSAPRRVSLGNEVRFSVQLSNQGTVAHRDVVLDGPYLPWDGKWSGERPIVKELKGGATAQLTCTASFNARGEHLIEPFHAAAVAPFSLFYGPGVLSSSTRLLVVPRIAPIARLTTPMVRKHQPGGVALASKTGESMDLLGVRPYRPGDPVRDLHARTWARTGKPSVREYQEEYFTRVGVVVDTDISVADMRRLEGALSLGAGVVAWLTRGEALIDLLVVGSEVHQLTLGRSLGYLDQALDLLACVKPGPKLNARELADRLAPHLPRLSCVVFLSLAWDESRAELADRVRRSGVGCKAIALLAPGQPSAVASAELVSVPVDAIEGRVPLWL